MLNIIQNTIGAIRRVGESVVRAGLKMWLPFTKVEPLGENLVTNGDFATDSNWQKGAGWEISGGTANAVFETSTPITQIVDGFTSGRVYKVKFEVTSVTNGYIRVYAYVGAAGVFSNVFSSTELQTGIYETTFEFGGSNKSLRFYGSTGSTGGFEGSIDNISVEEYAQETPDISGNDNNAILKTGKALVFDGNDSVETVFPSSKDIKTIAFWIYPTHSASGETLFYFGGTGQGTKFLYLNHLTLRKDSFGGMDFSVYVDGVYRGNTYESSNYVTLAQNEWQRVVLTTSTAKNTISDTFDVAYKGFGSHGRFKMSDLQIYGAEFTTDDIAYDYANPQKLVTDNASSSVTLNDLHAWWHMSEGDGTIAFDSAPLIGKELLVNGDFSDASTGWQSSGSNWTFSNNTAIYVGDGSANELLQNINFVGGKLYKIVVDVASISGTLKVRFNNDQANKVTFNTVGENIIYITPSGTGLINNDISISRETGVFNAVINSISIKEVYNIDGETYDGSSLGATYDDAQERIPQLGMMNWSKGSNVLPYSNDFSNSHWSINGVDLDSGYIAPDGTATAYKVSQNGIGILFDANVNPNIGVTRSIWAKTVSGTGTVHLTSNFGNTNSIFTITNEWQRFSATSGSAAAGNFYAVDFRGSSTLTEVILWGAQEEVNVGDSLSAFRRTNGTALTDATLISSATDSQKDILGNAVRVKGSGFNLDGTGYAEVLDDSAFDIPGCNNVDEGAFSFMGWAKFNYTVQAASSFNVIYSNGANLTATGSFSIASENNNKISAFVSGNYITTTTTQNIGDWVHFALTRDVNGSVKLYINKTLENTISQTNAMSNTGSKKVAWDGTANDRFYNERIDDVKFYNRELSSDQVEQNYNATKSGHNN